MYALAVVTGNSAITSEMTTAITTAGNDVLASVQDVLNVAVPASLAVMGLTLAVTIGMRLFKKLVRTGS